MPPDELVQRFLRLPTEESGTAIEWADGSGTLASIVSLAAFSSCFFLELQLEIPAERLPSDLVWLTDALSEPLELHLEGDAGYEIASTRPANEESGVLLIGAPSRPIPEQGVVVRHWGKGRYWCWPLPPDGPVSASIVWPQADIDEVIGTFSGEHLKMGARRSLTLDVDMRHTRPKD